jgi:ribosomal protein S12 methylthiotransferase accessory factor
VPAAASTIDCVDLASATLLGRLGLVRSVKEILLGPGEPRLYSASSVSANVTVFARSDIQGHTGAIGFSWSEAAAGAIGECIERFCCAHYEWDDLVLATQAELGDEAVGMDAFALYSPAQCAHPQFPFAQWTRSLPIHWAKGKSLITGETRFVPAALVYIPYVPRTGNGTSDLLALAVSSGQACHTDPVRALLTGLYEVVERDAFMIMWLRSLQMPRVDFMSDPSLRRIYERYFSGCGLTFHIFDITLDIAIPTMLCIVEGNAARGPFIGVGAATRRSEREAIVKALKEGAQDMVWARDLIRRKPDWRPDPDFMNVRNFEDHVRLFCEPEMKRHVDFLLDSTAMRPVREVDAVEDPARDLAWSLDAVRARGLDAVVVDTTTRDVSAAGFSVPKVFVPGTVPLSAVHGLPCVGSRRLFDVPIEIGYQGPLEDRLNPIPHPFP